MKHAEDYAADIGAGLLVQFPFLTEAVSLGMKRESGSIVLPDGETYGGIDDSKGSYCYLRYNGGDSLVNFAPVEEAFSSKPLLSATVPLRVVFVHNCENCSEFLFNAVSYLRRHTFATDLKAYSPRLNVESGDQDPERIYGEEVPEDALENRNAKVKLTSINFDLVVTAGFDECENFVCNGC
jgi:hypothetical protein